jgi:hypothetical protein
LFVFGFEPTYTTFCRSRNPSFTKAPLKLLPPQRPCPWRGVVVSGCGNEKGFVAPRDRHYHRSGPAGGPGEGVGDLSRWERQGYRDGGRAVSDNLKRSRESPARRYNPCESRGVSRARYAAARRRRRPNRSPIAGRGWGWYSSRVPRNGNPTGNGTRDRFTSAFLTKRCLTTTCTSTAGR